MGEVSNAELARRLDDLASSFREDFAEIRQSHASFVLREVYDAKNAALTARVAEIQAQQEREASERKTDRRWAIGSIVIPVVILAYQIISNLQGAAS